MSRQHPKPQSSCCSSARLRLWAGSDRGHHHHWCLERPDLEHASEFQISAVCILQVFATKMLPHHECYLVSFLFEKFWSIHFDLGNSSNRQLQFLLRISFHRLRFLQCPAPSFSLLSLGSNADCEQKNEFLCIMFKLYVDKGNYKNWNRLSTGTLCRTMCTSWAGCPCWSDTSAEECWHSQGCVVVVQRLLQTPSRAG